MLNELKIDELLNKVDSRYGLVLVAARRARQINEYAATLGLNESLGIPGPQVHTRSQHPLSIAFEELRSGKLEVGFKRPAGGCRRGRGWDPRGRRRRLPEPRSWRQPSPCRRGRGRRSLRRGRGLTPVRD